MKVYKKLNLGMVKRMGDGKITKLAYTTSRTKKSLRTTVPSFIVKALDLNVGDMLSWSLRVENGELVIIVKSIKNKGE